MSDWIDMAADGIVARLEQWEGEAGQLAQQDDGAGDRHLRECVLSYLRLMWAYHSREAISCE